MRTWAHALIAVVLPVVSPAIADNVLKPDRWLQHLQQDLLPYWSHPDAHGKPIGNFPSQRCNDGRAFQADSPCAEIAEIPWLTKDRQHLVALSRQIYAYGVAFHMTGDVRFLDLAEAGLRHQLAHFVEPNTGIFFEQIKGSDLTPEPSAQTSQVQAYGLLGLSFLYYLTGSEDLLQTILDVQRAFKDRFFDPDRGLYIFPGDDQPSLASQLDHLNAYMRLIAPLLPPDARQSWQTEMVRISEGLRSSFYDSDRGVFLNKLSAPDFDYGHSIKAFWFIRMTGILADRNDLVTWSEVHGRALLDQAFSEGYKTWVNARTLDGKIEAQALSWVHAELDQYAASISLRDDSVGRLLKATYGFWLTSFVDRSHGGIWDNIDLKKRTSAQIPPKHWPWKAGYHSFEHVLVSYIAAGGWSETPVRLFFAQNDPNIGKIQPYYFSAKDKSLSETRGADGRQIQTVEFREITW